MDLVEFELDGRRFALPMTRVIELAPTVRSHALPGAPAVVEGMVNHAGSPVPLIDMRKVFGVRAAKRSVSATWNDHLILARGATRVFALRVDRAVGLLQIEEEAIRQGAPSKHVRGVAVLSDQDLLYIQDLDALLSVSEEAELDAAIAETTADTTTDPSTGAST